jgi:hypothetical protein
VHLFSLSILTKNCEDARIRSGKPCVAAGRLLFLCKSLNLTLQYRFPIQHSSDFCC